MERSVRRATLPLIIALLVVACAAPPTREAGAPDSAGQPETPPQRKAITIALQAEINALTTGLNQAAANSPPSRFFHEFTNAYLTTRDANDEVRPWLAESLPSQDDGTWKVADDGRMEVIWRLRRGVMWHDGHELTAEDVKFGWEAERDPITQLKPQGIAGLVDAVDTPDPYTVVFHWRRTSYQGGELGESQFDVLPRRVLEEALLAGKDSLPNHPYFSTPEQFVGSGPYRPVSWDRGAAITLQAFDQYFLGRPKIDLVTIKFIRDAQTGMANLLAGTVDISYQQIGYEQAKYVREEWAKARGGTVELQLNHVRHLLPQLRQDYARPADVTNVTVRRALLHAMDRDELAEAILPGAGQAANSITYPTSAIGRATAQRVVSYPYDPARAAALFEEAGWQRGSDGMLRKGGNRFTLEYRSSGATFDAGALFAPLQQQLLRAGVELEFHEIATTNTPADTATFPGVWFTSVPPDSLSVLTRFSGRLVAAPENRFATQNRNGYTSARADRILEAIDSSIRMDDCARNWGELWQVLMEDVALFPMYYFPAPLAVRSRISGALPANPLNPPTYQLHLWDVQER
jgi:peptide/nickel transport system substrate-binding protein